MRAAVLHASGDLRVEAIPTPTPGAGEVLVKVAYSGVCGSDIPRLIKDGAHYFPIVLGHEFSGVIEAVGDGVDPALVGRKAACAPLMPNFQDPECVKGNYSLGKGYGFIGSRQQGGYAEYVAMPQLNAVLLPDDIELLAGAFMEPLTVGLHALNIMAFVPGRSVAMTGVGSIGLLLLQSIRALGAGSVTVFDIDDAKLEIARTLGADAVFNSGQADVVAPLGGSFDFVFETAGVPAAERLALHLASPKGHVMFVGTPHVPLVLEPAQFELINRKELVIQGSWMNYSAPFPGWEWTFGAEALATGRIQTDALIDRILPLSQAQRIPALLGMPGQLKGKLVLDCAA